MCGTCGCGEGELRIDGRPHHHHHGPALREVELHLDLMAKNDAHAARNRAALAARGVLALNLVSSPGSGKTTLLVETLKALSGPACVIEGDQQTSRDADRIRETGTAAVQINTGRGCHLDAHMVGHAIADLAPPAGSVLFIENVGNLVCPALFDLGEAAKVLVFSVTEGEDKPLKYPDMFAASALVLIAKADLLPHVDFDLDAARANIRRINPKAEILLLSARTGAGMTDWLGWLASRQAAPAPVAGG